MKLKYVIVKDDVYNEKAIIFPESLTHVEVAFFYHRHDRVLSAGFCYIEGNDVSAGGKSESLHLDSRTEDVVIIKRSLGIKDVTNTA